MSGDLHIRRHSIALVRAAVNNPKIDEQQFLLKLFQHLPISVYCLPVHNMFDYALVGPISKTVVDQTLVSARERFNAVAFMDGTRQVYHGIPLLGSEDEVLAVLEKATICADVSTCRERLYAMMFFDDLYNDDRETSKFRDRLTKLLKNAKWNPDYCLSMVKIDPGGMKQEQIRLNGRREFEAKPIEKCNSWLRISRSVNGEPLQDVLDDLHSLHYKFRLEFGREATTMCFPVVPIKPTKEIAKPDEMCLAAVATAFPKDTFRAVWFGFGREETPSEPTMSLPIGNFVVSAASGVGKNNAVFTLMRSFLAWKGDLGVSPGFSDFAGAVFINLKGEGAKDDVVSGKNEARLLKGVLGKSSLKPELVKPADLLRYVKTAPVSMPFVAYTESDGTTKWHELIKLVVADTQRRSRGILFVFDEAFRVGLDESQRQDVFSCYREIYNLWRTVGVRAILIGQELAVIRSSYPTEAADIFGKSTVVIGRQDDSSASQEVVMSAKGSDEVVRWLDCASHLAMNEVADGFPTPSPYKLGPIIVRPSLYGSQSHAMPCHIEPTVLKDEEWKFLPVEWWKG